MTKSLVAAALAGLVLSTAAFAQSTAGVAVASERVKVGMLGCDISAGIGMIVGSTKHVSCEFAPADGRREHYSGTISKVGLDVGFTAGGVLVWGVFAPTSDLRKGSLSGDYIGASAQATVGLGLGANALTGGFDKSIALQPLSVEGSKGLNVAAGIGSISLKEAM